MQASRSHQSLISDIPFRSDKDILRSDEETLRSDEDILKTLTNATEWVAGAFKARSEFSEGSFSQPYPARS